MLHQLKLIAGSSVLIGGLAFATYAEDQQTMPSSPGNNQGMMGAGTAEMMHQMPQQMTRMMENCNRMMESYMQQPTPPEPEKKG